MTDRRYEAVQRIEEAATNLRKRWPRAWAIRRDSTPGLPGGVSYDREGTGNKGGSSPVEAIAHRQRAFDQAGRRIDRALRQIEHAFGVLAHDLPAPISRDDAAELAAAFDDGSIEMCHLCAEAGGQTPALVTSDAGGALDVKVPLCRWHRDVCRAAGRRTTPAESERHLQGRRVVVRPAPDRAGGCAA